MPEEQPILTEEEAEAVAIVFQNPGARAIIKLLLERNEPLYHNEIHSILGGSKSTIHRNLAELKISGILRCTKGSKSASSKVLVDYYEIDREFIPLLKNLAKVL